VSRGQVDQLKPVPRRESLEAGFHEDLADQLADLGLVVGDERERAVRSCRAGLPPPLAFGHDAPP
jgi:hypothetical protein